MDSLDLFVESSSEDDQSSLCNTDTIKMVIKNITAGKMKWNLYDDKDVDYNCVDKVDCIIDQVMLSVDYTLIDDFLIIHRLLISTTDLIDKLLLKFAQIIDYSAEADEEPHVKVRVYAILQRWIQSPYVNGDLVVHREYLKIRLEAVKETTKSTIDLKLISSLINKLSSCTSTSNDYDDDNEKAETISIKSTSSSNTFRWRNLFSRSLNSTGESIISRSSHQDSMTSLDSMLSVYSGAHFLLATSTINLVDALFVMERRVLLDVKWSELIEFPLKTATPPCSVKSAVDHFNIVYTFILIYIYCDCVVLQMVCAVHLGGIQATT